MSPTSKPKGKGRAEENGPSTITTSYLLENLHCPSCVSSIKQILEETCKDDIIWVSPNIVTSVVTVEHKATSRAAIKNMAKSLEDIGFDIEAVSTSYAESDDIELLDRITQADPGERSKDIAQSGGGLDGWLWRQVPKGQNHNRQSRDQAHREKCEACRLGKVHDDEAEGGEEDVKRKQPAKDGKASQLRSTKPSVTELESVGVGTTEPVWRATFAVGGMTCAVCMNTITDELTKQPWITNVVVNLVSNSATVDFIGEGRAAEVAESIEDLGYEATLDTVVNLDQKKDAVEKRTVEIRIEGLFCPKCPDRIMHTLEGFHRDLEIITKPTVSRPIIKIEYMPEPPDFTIRRIVSAITATDPSFTAALYHPPTLEERSRKIRAKHQRELMARLVFTIAIAIPTFVLGIVYMSLIPDGNSGKDYLMMPWTSGISRLQIALFILATPVYFFGADIFHVRAFKEVRAMWKPGSRTPMLKRFTNFGSMNMLISLGTTVAYVSSIAQMIVAAVEKPDHLEESQIYFDTVVFLTMFILAGRYIEAVSKSKTGDAVEALGKLRPTTATLFEKSKDGGDERTTVIDVDLLEVGDFVRVPHGASPPGDGVIVEGGTSFDESSLTGESRLVKKSVGDEVFAGTVNKDSAVLMRVVGVGGSSMLDQIVNVVREGQTKRAPMERIADVLTAYFVPCITLIAIVTWVTWLIIAQSGVVDQEMHNESSFVAFALRFAIAVFVVACPCGLALAAPTAIFVGGGIAAKHGILAKGGGEAFEKASKISCVVFDKTGTLTQGGAPKVIDGLVYPDEQGVDDSRAAKALGVLKAVEESSSHPIARAIVGFCDGRETAKVTVNDIQEIAGKGMAATFDGDSEFIVGNEALMQDFAIEISDRTHRLLDQWKAEAKSIALAATKMAGSENYILAAALSISDPVRPEAIPVIKALKEAGKQVRMISGDNPTTANAVAQKVGIDPLNVLAGVLPSQKAEKISYLQKTLKAPGKETSARRAMVAMVGDGINDSPALTTADVGIAIGSGSDVAISSADFVLVTSDLRAVVTLLDLSKKVFTRIKFNFGWALVFNLLAVPIAAGVLYPVRANGERITLDPVWASLAMACSSISVVLSSLALRWGLPGLGFRARKVEVPEGGGEG